MQANKNTAWDGNRVIEISDDWIYSLYESKIDTLSFEMRMLHGEILSIRRELSKIQEVISFKENALKDIYEMRKKVLDKYMDKQVELLRVKNQGIEPHDFISVNKDMYE